MIHPGVRTTRERLAPNTFRRELKKYDPNMDCWWNPWGTRDVRLGGALVRLNGCWSVWKKIPSTDCLVIGRSRLWFKTHRWVDVYQLSNAFGEGWWLGPWVIHALKHSDITKRGRNQRHKELNELNRRDTEKKFIDIERRAHEVSKDKLHQRAIELNAAQFGNEQLSGDERKALVRYEELKQKEFERMAEREMRRVEYYR